MSFWRPRASRPNSKEFTDESPAYLYAADYGRFVKKTLADGPRFGRLDKTKIAPRDERATNVESVAITSRSRTRARVQKLSPLLLHRYFFVTRKRRVRWPRRFICLGNNTGGDGC